MAIRTSTQQTALNAFIGAGFSPQQAETVLDQLLLLVASSVVSGNVTITGGTIDNTVIGGTTPAAGTFTTLNSRGLTILGGPSGGEAFRATPDALAVNYLEAKGGPSSGFSVILQAEGQSSDVQCLFASKGTFGHVFKTAGSGGPTQVSIIHTAGATRAVTLTGSNGGNPTISTTAGSLAVGAPLVLSQTTLLQTSVALSNGAAANTGTLTNAPAAGNPTKWISINDNGTTRYIPAW